MLENVHSELAIALFLF